MSRSLSIAFLGVALVVAGLVSADANPRTVKIGLVNLERTLVETKAGQRASKKFEETRKKKQSELDKEQKSLQAAIQAYQKQRSILKPEVARKREAELQARAFKLQELVAKLERDLANERAKLIQTLLKKAAPVIKEVAKQQGVALVVDATAVVWADQSLDLTDKVNKQLN